MTRGGLPHSDIPGSKLVCSSPGLFAACHVLHRLLAPRHSPYTLSSLTIRNSKLTLTNCLHISWSATVPCNTACVVVGKNYRVQNIQLSKIRLAGLRRQSVNVGHLSARRSRSAHNRCRRRCRRGPKAPSLHRNLFKERQASIQARHVFAPGTDPSAGLPAVTPRGEGWWRIPGSNR